MMCYKDRTYCNFSNVCIHGLNCDRAYSDQILEEAKKSGLPVAIFTDPPECFRSVKKR